MGCLVWFFILFALIKGGLKLAFFMFLLMIFINAIIRW